MIESGVSLEQGAIRFPISLMPEWASSDIMENGNTLIEVYVTSSEGHRFEEPCVFRRWATEARSEPLKFRFVTDEIVLVELGVPDLGISITLQGVKLNPGDTFGCDLRIESADHWNFTAFL